MSAKQKLIDEIFDKYTVVYLTLHLRDTHEFTFREIYCINKLDDSIYDKSMIFDEYNDIEYIELYILDKCNIFELIKNITNLNNSYKLMPEYKKNIEFIMQHFKLSEDFKPTEYINNTYINFTQDKKKLFTKIDNDMLK